METCKNCLHYEICTFHIAGNENEKCPHYTPTADVVPRETVEQIFEEIDMLFIKDLGKHYGYPIYAFNKNYYELLKKKYIGGQNDE